MSIKSGILTLLAESDKTNTEYKNLIGLLSDYYVIDDIKNNTNYADVFKELFSSSVKRSNEIIASEYFISTRTLDRYIKSCNDLALKICKKYKTQFGSLLYKFAYLKDRKAGRR